VGSSIPLVGIGSSAGGMEALGNLLEALPARLGASLVVVSHLDRTHESLLPEILARETRLRVLEARDGVTPVADHIYVISPNVTLTVVDGRIHLDPPVPGASNVLCNGCRITA
jgi:two-component system, chemotaxis family, CheB/CheR fusion protein